MAYKRERVPFAGGIGLTLIALLFIARAAEPGPLRLVAVIGVGVVVLLAFAVGLNDYINDRQGRE